MCLTYVLRGKEALSVPIDRNNRGAVIAYKVFEFSLGEIHSLYQGDKTRKIPKMRWVDERDYRHDKDSARSLISASNGQRYSYGWHAFLSPHHARYYSIEGSVFMVLLKGNITIGAQGSRHSIVGEKMFILKKVNIARRL